VLAFKNVFLTCAFLGGFNLFIKHKSTCTFNNTRRAAPFLFTLSHVLEQTCSQTKCFFFFFLKVHTIHVLKHSSLMVNIVTNKL